MTPDRGRHRQCRDEGASAARPKVGIAKRANDNLHRSARASRRVCFRGKRGLKSRGMAPNRECRRGLSSRGTTLVLLDLLRTGGG